MSFRELLLVLAFAAVAGAAGAAAQESNVAERPRIGLALSGGGARGLAHVGVLEVLRSSGFRST